MPNEETNEEPEAETSLSQDQVADEVPESSRHDPVTPMWLLFCFAVMVISATIGIMIGSNNPVGPRFLDTHNDEKIVVISQGQIITEQIMKVVAPEVIGIERGKHIVLLIDGEILMEDIEIYFQDFKVTDYWSANLPGYILISWEKGN